MKLEMKLLIAAGLMTTSAFAQMTMIYEIGDYDSARVRTNNTIDGTSLAQWDLMPWVVGNVGYTTYDHDGDGAEGTPQVGAYWYTAIGFGADRGLTLDGSPVADPELYNTLTDANTTSIGLNMGAFWTEGSPKGVDVDVYLVPGMYGAPGSYLDMSNSWYLDYNSILITTIDVDTLPTTNTDWNDFNGLNAPTLAEREANRVLYDFTGEFQSAVTAGDLTATSSWGIALVVSGITPSVEDLAANSAGKSGTVFDINSAQLVVTQVPEPSTYAAIFGFLALAGVMIRRRLQNR